MSKAPQTRPDNTSVFNKVTNMTTYTYWREGRLKNGDIVYHRQNVTRNKSTIKTPRKGRSDKRDIADSVYKQNIQKRKALNNLKRVILNNDDYTYVDVMNLYEKFKTPQLIKALC